MTEHSPLPALLAHLRGNGFVVLTHNQDNESDSRFEAWAYEGPLDFDTAEPLRFGLGSDPVDALEALNLQLSMPSA